MVLVDISREFYPETVGFGLARLWTVDGHLLVPVLDGRVEIPHCPLSLEPFQDPVLLADGFLCERTHIEKWLTKIAQVH